MYQPLADLLRPQTLDEVYGQEHILGQGAILRRLIDSGNIPNLVFYGPSGTGKTTVANIIAKQTNRTLFKLNATTASTADIHHKCLGIVISVMCQSNPSAATVRADICQLFFKNLTACVPPGFLLTLPIPGRAGRDIHMVYMAGNLLSCTKIPHKCLILIRAHPPDAMMDMYRCQLPVIFFF